MLSAPDTLFIGVSTKMYMGYAQSLAWLEQLVAEVDARPALAAGRVVPFVIPSFPVLPAAARMLEGTSLVLGAQNCGWSDGPWTGEVSPSMLAELGAGLVEIGHAERRRFFAEDEAMIALKVSAAVDSGLTPLLCVGERDVGDPEAAADTVFRQIKAAVAGDWSVASQLVIAYEPVWAIGAPEPASAGYVSRVAAALRESLGQHGLARMPVVYGGSAQPGLLPQLDGVSGLFLGRFAHDATNFGRVLDEALSFCTADAPKTPSKGH
ncbi:triose-phosphate isomerase [Arthrobacter sp. AK01]|uniref:triose-phosphate isomerase family protein n=1 Tax=Arthrobacter sp. AK01 TaxID=2894084 RepID=UPI001E3D3E01|nr:triose-phosphate isomerase family protein [Arthrobacter sp. AK01]MCD4852159.1 triose-phosphate isomerase [Arthrobacter sp. AK01]